MRKPHLPENPVPSAGVRCSGASAGATTGTRCGLDSPGHPGSLDAFDWHVTRDPALAALAEFTSHRFVKFGRYQGAMWTTTPHGWHARFSAAMNLRLLDPREVIDAVLHAHRTRGLPLASVEGFMRQVLGWREFIRGMSWMDMPGMAQASHIDHLPLPAWYWTGQTDMACMRDTVGQTLALGYAHHIQRLMGTGNFALVAGIDPGTVCDWYLAAYVDAVDWAERPNTAGMALYANGGRFASKPCAASGAYIRRMSKYCGEYRYRSDRRGGEGACPLTVLFSAFLDRHETEFTANPRTALMARNLARLDAEDRGVARRRASRRAARLDSL